MPPVIEPSLLDEIADQINKIINIPFLNEKQELHLIVFILKMLTSLLEKKILVQ